MKIPVILILGVATTLDLPRSILHSEALQCLRPFKFTLGNIRARMDAVADALLLKQSYGFFIGHKVASFMRNYFSNHGGTLSCFIRALKVSGTTLDDFFFFWVFYDSMLLDMLASY